MNGNITRDVVGDLLPAYFSGEASADTRALVEEFFAQDPEFERLARTDVDRLLGDVGASSDMEEIEMQAFRKTKKLLRLRSWILGFAIYCTFAPMTFYSSEKTGTVFLFADNPVAVAVLLGMAAVLWTGYALLRLRLRPSAA
jgi:anti-sigma factor RsiW